MQQGKAEAASEILAHCQRSCAPRRRSAARCATLATRNQSPTMCNILPPTPSESPEQAEDLALALQHQLRDGNHTYL